jgi:hypothetical protein
MPILDIEGRRVEVDDSFLSMTPDQQNATVDEIARSIGAAPATQPTQAKPRAGLFDDLIPSRTKNAPNSSVPIQMQAPHGSLVGVPATADDAITRRIVRRNYGGPDISQPKKAGLFDDLIPPETNQPSGAGLFDDLIPQSRSQEYTDSSYSSHIHVDAAEPGGGC